LAAVFGPRVFHVKQDGPRKPLPLGDVQAETAG
jgi:hypothetical protein